MAREFNNKKVDTRESINLKQQFKKVDTGIVNGVFVYTSPLTVGEFAKQINKPVNDIIKYFFMKGKMLSLTTLMTEEQMGEICLEYNYDFEKKVQVDETNLLDNLSVKDKSDDLIKRAPVITIMGHVDHGKTTLLDFIRKTKIAFGEAGGITQHIGAYQINYGGEKITFIDTPGHEAFTEMRARGAGVTDIVVLVVAADDGIKPQTEEAIDHAKAANVPIIVFVNKMDKLGVNPEKTMSELAQKGLMVEEWGGDVLCIKGSALTGKNVDKLIESIIIMADMLELKANPNRLALGVAIEANMDKGHGPVATLLVKNGTLQRGDYIVIGGSSGRIRAIFNDDGKEIAKAYPGQPVKITGLSEIPLAGAKFIVLKDEQQAKDLAKKIREKQVNLDRLALTKKIDLDNKQFNIIVKADVQGSLEAIKGMINKTEIPGTQINILRSAIGAISESDIQLSKASNGIIIGFNVKPSKIVKDIADEQKIHIYFYNIIYKFKEDLISMLYGTLDPIEVEEELGEAEVKQIWKHSTIGTIAGCLITSGEITRNAKARVVRDGIVVYTNNIASLRQGKETVNSVSAGKECGIVIENFNDIKEGDVIQTFKVVEKLAKDVKNAK